MLLEIIKVKNKYVLVNPPKKSGSHFFIDTDKGKIIPGHKKTKEQSSLAYQTVSQMARKYPENEFLELSLQLTSKNYVAGKELNNEQLLNDAYSEKRV